MFELALLSTEQSNATGKAILGLYMPVTLGGDVAKDVEWTRKSAGMGNYEVYSMLGTMYLQGDEVE